MEPIPLRDVAVFAGATEEKHIDGPRFSNAFFRPLSVCPSSSGELYVADSGNHRIRFINKYGYVSTHAGDGRRGLRNGRLESASFNQPSGICRSSQGHLLISDSGNHVIRIATTQGSVKTYAGTGEIGEKDGAAAEATFNGPLDLCIDFQGQLYISDTGNHRIRMISAARLVSTVTGSSRGYRDGARDEALFNSPSSVRLTPSRMGTLLIADMGNHCIRLLNNGYVTTFAGRCESGFHASTKRSEALFNAPFSLAINSDESVYVSDAGNHCIYYIAPNGVVTILSGGTPGCQDGSKEQAAFKRPGGLCLVAQRQLILAETGHGRILVVKPDGSVANFAGRSRSGTVDGAVSKSTFFKPQALFSASSNDLLVADSMSNKIRRIRNGVVTTFAGSPERGSGNGRKDLANFDSPTGICISPSNTVYIADSNNHVIRHITDGTVFNFAGTGVPGFMDGPGDVAKFNTPIGLILTPQALLTADSQNHRIRMIMKDASVHTFAGNGAAGYADGPSAEALFNCPTELVYSPDGTVFVSDHLNHSIRLVRPDGSVHTLSGTGYPGNEDGPVSISKFNLPRGLALTPDNKLLVADTGNRSIRLVDQHGNTSTFVSMVKEDEDEEGVESNVDPEQVPTALSLTNSGVLFIADMLRNQILYLPCPQWDLTRQVPKSKDFVQFFSFTDLCNAPSSTFDFTLTHNPSGRSFPLHRFFIQARCPVLLQSGPLELIQAIPSLSAIQLLVRLLLSDYISPLTSMDSIHAFCELAHICAILQKPRWVSMVKYHIIDFLTEKHNTHKRSSGSRRPSFSQQQPHHHQHQHHAAPSSPRMDVSPGSPSTASSATSQEQGPDLQAYVNECLDILLHVKATCSEDSDLIDLLTNHIKSFSRSSHPAHIRSRTPVPPGGSELPGASSTPTPPPDNTMISFRFAKPMATARHTPPPGYPSDSPPLPRMASPKPHHSSMDATPTLISSETAPFSPDLAKLLKEPSLLLLVQEKLSTPYVDMASTFQPMENALAADMQILLDRCFDRRKLLSSQSSGDDSASSATTISIDASMTVDAPSSAVSSPDKTNEMEVDSVASTASPGAGLAGDSNLGTRQARSFSASSAFSHGVHQHPHQQQQHPLGFGPSSSSQSSSSSSLSSVATSSSAMVGNILEPDFVIQIGASRFPCHKMVLFARWGHFAELFRSSHSAISSGVLTLHENPLTPEVVEGLLRYLYTNEVENLPTTESFCLGVLKSALLYEFVAPGDLSNLPVKGFELLLSYCRNALMKPLTIQNCAPLLNTLYEYGSTTQQNRVVSYISRNLKQVMDSQDAAKALATVPSVLHSKILFSHFSMLQVLEDQ